MTKLDCREVSRLLSDGLDKDLPANERARLRLHLVVCEACRSVEQQLGVLRDALRRLGIDRAARDRRDDDAN